MHRHFLRHKQTTGLLAIGLITALLLFTDMFRHKAEPPESDGTISQTAALKQARDEGYQDGYTTGHEAGYDKGFEAAEQEIGSGTFTRTGLLGFVVGLSLGFGLVVSIKRQEITEWFEHVKKQRELRKAFRTIPSGLSPEIDEIAHQIARSYINILTQLRMAKGYMIAQYSKQWIARLNDLMHKAVRLMKLIKELEQSRAAIDEQELTKTIRSLHRTAKSPKSDDAARNVAVKSLHRAKQTRADLQQTQKNLEHCTASLQGITKMLDSMQLKISNLKVNTKETDALEELSTDLEIEMSALEEALHNVTR